MRDNSKTKGDIAELKVAALFAEKGYFVSRPLTDNAPYDLIVDNGKTLKKVQVKARIKRRGRLSVELFTSMTNYSRRYEDNDFDLLAVYSIDCGRIAVIEWEEIKGQSSLILWIDLPKGNINRTRSFEQYLFL